MNTSVPPIPPAPSASAGHAALLSRIPLGLRMLVLVGGGAALAALLRRRDPAANLVTVDHLDAEIPLGADAIIWPDLLARQADPLAALRRAAERLSPEGVLVFGMPNPEHWSVLSGMIRGGWRPGPAGPVEPVHLRPMPPEAVRAALQEAGLVAVDLMPQGVEEAAANEFTKAMAPALPALGVEPLAFFRRVAPRRHIWRAAKRRPTPLVVVAHVLKPVGGVNDVRIDLPLGGMASWPGIITRIAQNPETPDLPEGTPRIMLLHRRLLNSPDAPAYVNGFRKRGWVVVQEFDDDPAHWPVIAGSNHFAFRGVHAVQTTTPRLEALFREFNGEIGVFPNTVAELPEPVNFGDPNRLTLFLGALRREEDTAPFLPVLNEILAEAGDRLAVEVLFDRGTFDALRTPHKRFGGILPYAEYRALMARCEIAFLPLNDTRFNNFKSDLKFVEAGAHRLATLASPVVYGGTVRDGETGLVIRSPAALRDALRRFLARPEEARAIGDAARGWVRENRLLAGQVRARIDWYRDLWARRAELDATMLRRAPEYARLGA